MKNIIIGDENVGSVEITSNRDIPGQSEFAVKALAGIQLLCINGGVKIDPKLTDVLDIIQDSIDRIRRVYDGEQSSQHQHNL